MAEKKLSIYLHIPFCVKKCLYCDFLSFSTGKQNREDYVNQMLKEVENVPITYCETKPQIGEEDRWVVDTVFIGGGTPSILTGDQIKTILCKLRERFPFAQDAEITIESNPGTINLDKCFDYKEAGINRISIGLQSANDEELRFLGRIHTYQDFLDAFRCARNAGFQNINVDIMSALPGQTMKSYRETISKVLALQPEHISAYSLIIEPGTPFADMELTLPNEDEERQMYYETSALLKEQGYFRYEISNYAKKGYECRHNTGYWTGKDYLGLGLGASSMVNNVRWKNTSECATYLKSPDMCRVEVENLSLKDRMEQFMFLGLRMTNGVNICDFKLEFGSEIDTVYGKIIEELEEKKLLIREKNMISLSDFGCDISNYVFSRFLLDD